jgi:hypothetical protein
MNTDSKAAAVQDLVSLHEKLSGDLRNLNIWLKEADEYGRPQFGQLGDRVRAIREVVARHFAKEEEGGYMSAPVGAAPHLADRAGMVLADHARLLAEFDRLGSALCECPTKYTCWSDARRDVQQVLAQLEAHEHRENELWQEAFDTELTSLD